MNTILASAPTTTSSWFDFVFCPFNFNQFRPPGAIKEAFNFLEALNSYALSFSLGNKKVEMILLYSFNSRRNPSILVEHHLVGFRVLSVFARSLSLSMHCFVDGMREE
ncbi:hypothetical protein NE237_030572 [Protea cynaroides]|uniref:Uncharacterized protein n=1 Tax=Protea cynaroides TaxID=273540 RepID=A0A9Q0GWF6_9MAGN|nr:hypothetical protein NE237_030572 [Protea cynaroides]